jgi:hypothetical protein
VLTLIGFLGNRSINGWLVDWASGLVTLTLQVKEHLEQAASTAREGEPLRYESISE